MAGGSARGNRVRDLRTPFQAPQANEVCERLIGTLRQECLDFLIPLTEAHLRRILKEWGATTTGAAHTALGVPEPPPGLPVPPLLGKRLPPQSRVARSVLGGLHQEYGLERAVA